MFPIFGNLTVKDSVMPIYIYIQGVSERSSQTVRVRSMSKSKIGTSIKHGSGNAPILSYSPPKFQAKQTTMHTGNANGYSDSQDHNFRHAAQNVCTSCDPASQTTHCHC